METSTPIMSLYEAAVTAASTIAPREDMEMASLLHEKRVEKKKMELIMNLFISLTYFGTTTTTTSTISTSSSSSSRTTRSTRRSRRIAKLEPTMGISLEAEMHLDKKNRLLVHESKQFVFNSSFKSEKECILRMEQRRQSRSHLMSKYFSNYYRILHYRIIIAIALFV